MTDQRLVNYELIAPLFSYHAIVSSYRDADSMSKSPSSSISIAKADKALSAVFVMIYLESPDETKIGAAVGNAIVVPIGTYPGYLELWERFHHSCVDEKNFASSAVILPRM